MNIIVAGSSRGIGFEVVRKFALSGDHKIVAISRKTEALIQLKNECREINPGSVIYPTGFDLEQDNCCTGLLPSIQKDLGSVDVLIYNAGLLINKPFSAMNSKDFNLMFNVNVKGAFELVQNLLGLFSAQSHVLTISSMGGYQGSAKFPGLSLYSASKGALAVLTECLAEELKDREIRCNCLALGAVQTEMLAEAFPTYKAPLIPEEMASFIVDFAFQGHRFFNGKILPVSLSTP